MGSYKANRNTEDEEKTLTEEEIAKINNKKNIDNGIEVMKAVDVPHVKAIGYAAEGVNKISGGKFTEKCSDIATKINRSSPMGKQIQGVSNNLSESGISDAAGKAASIKNGVNGNSTNSTDKISSKLNTNSSSINDSSKKNISSLVKGKNGKISPLKIKIILIAGISFFLLMIIVGAVSASSDYYNLKLTNETILASSSAGSIPCTKDEIRTKTSYVVDSSFNIEEDNINLISGENANYDWLANDGIKSIESKIVEDEKSIIILNLGNKDLENIDNYISFYKNLMEKYPNTYFYFLSLKPESDDILNQSIEGFNQKMFESFPNNYLNTYDLVKESNLENNSDINKKINDYVEETIYNNGGIVCSVGSISKIDDTSLSGGNAKLLNSGESLLSVLGQEKIDLWNANLKKDVQSAGIGSGAAPAMAAYDLIQGALNEGVIIPYFWGGGHGAISIGISPSWGSSSSISASGNSAQPAGSFHANGLDCSGFVSWALKNGGCSNFTPISSSEFKNLGDGINLKDAIPGDIAASDSHVMLILNNINGKLIVAEAKGAKSGIVFSSHDYSYFSNYKIVSMRDYYAKNCNG